MKETLTDDKKMWLLMGVRMGYDAAKGKQTQEQAVEQASKMFELAKIIAVMAWRFFR